MLRIKRNPKTLRLFIVYKRHNTSSNKYHRHGIYFNLLDAINAIPSMLTWSVINIGTSPGDWASIDFNVLDEINSLTHEKKKWLIVSIGIDTDTVANA